MNTKPTWSKDKPLQAGAYWFFGWTSNSQAAKRSEAETHLIQLSWVGGAMLYTEYGPRGNRLSPKLLDGIWTPCIIPNPPFTEDNV